MADGPSEISEQLAFYRALIMKLDTNLGGFLSLFLMLSLYFIKSSQRTL